MRTYIVIMGVQGAGKGTQAAILSKRLGIPHITSGGMFRAMEALATPLAREVQAIMNRGELVPDDLTVRVVKDRLTQPDAARGAILDGFPRTLAQAKALDALLDQLGEAITAVPVLELDRETAIKRIEGRRFSTANPETDIYNIYFNPPRVEGRSDMDGAPLVQRPDDNLEAVTRRIDTYFETTAPVLDYYRRRGLLRPGNADQPIEAVTRALLGALRLSRGVVAD